MNTKKRIKAWLGSSFGGFELLFPSHSKILNLLESQDLWFAFSDDRRAHALLKRQHHRPCYCRTQCHGAVIGQRNKLFRGDVPIAVELRRADVAGMNVTRPS